MINVIHTGPFGVNTMIVDAGGSEVFIVDPACCSFCSDETVVSRYLVSKGLEPKAIVLTHGHFDHVAGLTVLKKLYPQIKIFISREDASLIGQGSGSVQAEYLEPMGFLDFLPSVSNLPEPDGFLEDGKTLSECSGHLCEGKLFDSWTVMHTPGHTRGGVCLYNKSEKLLISGDTLFYGSWGRTDLPGGSESVIMESLRKIQHKIPGDVLVYPGHDYTGFELRSTLG